MQIFVKTLTGRSVALNVAASDTVRSVKQRIEQVENIAPDDQRLFCGCAGSGTLPDSCTLSDCNIQREATLHLSVCLLGGEDDCDDGDIRPGSDNDDCIVNIALTDDFLNNIYAVVYGFVFGYPIVRFIWCGGLAQISRFS